MLYLTQQQRTDNNDFVIKCCILHSSREPTTMALYLNVVFDTAAENRKTMALYLNVVFDTAAENRQQWLCN
jgi:hypothetical protein